MTNAAPADFREILATVDRRGVRHWVYATVVKGAWHRRRALVASALLLLYLLPPWLSFGGHQAVLLDIAQRKFFFFSAEFWATDSQFLFLILGLLAFSLFFFTAWCGRIWCGWACPETVFLEFIFRPLEILIEGKAGQRRRLDSSPGGVGKLLRKGVKLGAYSAVSLLIGATFVAYFAGTDALIGMLKSSPLQFPVSFGLTIAIALLALFQFGWFREQFCTILCPYARFQSVLMDERSIIIGYDRRRGEPRGKFDQPARGDCVDCGLCVRACPTGIDIRNGVQLECIACAQCIDACDSIMSQIKRPAGLIRYDTEEGLNTGAKRSAVRPRMLIYGALFVLFLGIFCAALSLRRAVDFQVLRGRGIAPYSLLPSGEISNQLQIRVSNKTSQERSFSVMVQGATGVRFVTPLNPFAVKPGEQRTLPLFIFVSAAAYANPQAREAAVTLHEAGRSAVSQQISIIGPD